MKEKKLLSLALAVCLAGGLLPISAFAADAGSTVKAIHLGSAPLEANANTANAATVYFGSDGADPYSWRVIGYGGEGAASINDSMTLLASGNISLSKFDGSGNDSNKYAGSTLKSAVDTIAANLSSKEQTAVVKRTLTSGSYNDWDTDCVAGDDVKDALLWPLSTKEANAVAEDLRMTTTDSAQQDWAMYYWWLRSPGYYAHNAAYVIGDGHVTTHGRYVGDEYGVRPAFYLNLNSVLFTSAAEGGKSSGTVGAGALTAVGDVGASEWKVTLHDADRDSFAVAETKVTAEAGETVSLTYSGAAVNAATAASTEYISAILAGSKGEPLYYGRLLQPETADGSVDITIPSNLEGGSYALKVFSEQYNGDKMTDYASAFIDVALTVPMTYTVTVTADNNGTASADPTFGTEGTEVKLSAKPNEGYQFKEWKVLSGSVTVEADAFEIGTADVEIQAVFEEIPELPQTTTPTFEPTETTFADSVEVTISCVTTGAAIRYSLDGSTYTTGAAVTLTDTATIYAIASAEGYLDSEVATMTYTKEDVSPSPSNNKKHEKPAEEPFPFTDVPEDAYFRKAVEWAWKNNVVAGTFATTFSPNTAATRAQMITFIWKAAGSPEPESTDNPFTDVSANDYYYKAVLWAVENGITAGVSADKFAPDQKVTRAQALTFLYNAAGRPAAGIEPFEDVDAGDYFAVAVAWAYENGITSGTSETKFSPDAECRRCEIVTFLYQVYGAE